MATYYIKDIESITGIKAHTIRIWEQRYNLVIPKRSGTNIRYYDDDDVKLLLNISLLNKGGLKISKIAGLSPAEIHHQALHNCHQANVNENLIHNLILATYNLDEARIEKIFSEFIQEHGFEKFMLELSFPFLQRLGDLWVSNTLHPAMEHFASFLILRKIQTASDKKFEKRKDAKSFLLLLPAGEMHELGLMFANFVIKSMGHDVLYLGQNTPIEDLFGMIKNYRVDSVMSVFTTCNSDVEPRKFVDEIVKVWPHVKIVLAGSRLKSKSCQCLGSLDYASNVTVLHEPCQLKGHVEGMFA